MQPPPTLADPYEVIDFAQPNPGARGMLLSWETFAQLFNSVLDQSGADIFYSQQGGILV